MKNLNRKYNRRLKSKSRRKIKNKEKNQTPTIKYGNSSSRMNRFRNNLAFKILSTLLYTLGFLIIYEFIILEGTSEKWQDRMVWMFVFALMTGFIADSFATWLLSVKIKFTMKEFYIKLLDAFVFTIILYFRIVEIIFDEYKLIYGFILFISIKIALSIFIRAGVNAFMG